MLKTLFQTEKITLEKVWDSIKAERRQKIRFSFLIVKKVSKLLKVLGYIISYGKYKITMKAV